MLDRNSFPEHFCPGCAKTLKHGPRTPWCFCGACVGKAADARGWPLKFIGMGSEWCYAEGYGPDAHDNRAVGVMCMIMGRPVIVHEARQGGLVAEPLTTEFVHIVRWDSQTKREASQFKNLVDLTSEKTLDQVIEERLVQPGRSIKY